jgi:hypothetical protein
MDNFTLSKEVCPSVNLTIADRRLHDLVWNPGRHGNKPAVARLKIQVNKITGIQLNVT